MSTVDLAQQCIETLQTEGKIYKYGQAIVRREFSHSSGMEALEQVKPAYLRWFIREHSHQDVSEKTIHAIADHICGTPVSQLPFREISGIVNLPSFRSDFSLITEPGYDQRSKLFYAPDLDLKTFSFQTDATKQEAKDSLRSLADLLKDFPFMDGEVDKLTYVSILLTLFLRSAIPDVVPSLCLDGNSQSVGKGLLCSMLSLIVFGVDCPVIGVPPSKSEWKSVIDGILLAGTTLQVIDNITGKFENDYLAGTLTTRRKNVRPLHSPTMVNIPHNTLWVFNGNDMKLDSDMAERVIRCRLQHPEAENRDQDKFYVQKTYGMSIPKLLRRDRARYMQACLNIICAWINAGTPRRTSYQLAKYGEWESILGGIFDWLAGDQLFLSTHKKNTAEVNSEKEETVTFLRAIMYAFDYPTESICTTDIIKRIFSEGSLRDATPKHLLEEREGRGQRIGNYLKNASTRKWSGVEIRPGNRRNNTATYYITLPLEKKKPTTVIDTLLTEDAA